jgi:predicted permease
VLAVFGILPGALFQTVRDFLAENVTPVIVGLLDAGLIGLAIVVGAIIVAVLGGIAGGRLGSRFHTEIDRTT